jgi:tetratricopeptide (TPR) repeat protein
MKTGVVVLLLCAASSLARAEDLDKARRYFQAGVEAYDEGKYEIALREFQHAHALSHNPELYFNMAACEEHENHFQAASLLLRQYVIEKPNADDRSKVEARIKVLEEREEAIHRLPGTEPPPLTHHEPPPKPAPVMKPNWVPTIIGASITGALGIGAIAAGAYALSEHSELQGSCGKTAAGCTSAQESAMKSAALATDVLIGLTAAAAITTIVLIVYAVKHPRAVQAARLMPRTTGAGMLGWSF